MKPEKNENKIVDDPTIVNLNGKHETNGHAPPPIPEKPKRVKKEKRKLEVTMPDGTVYTPPSLPEFDKEEMKKAKLFDREQLKAVVSGYYTLQKFRVKQSNRISAYKRQVSVEAFPYFLQWQFDCLESMEKVSGKILEYYLKGSDTPSHKLGQWCLGIRGVGPVITTALLSYIDFHRCTCLEWKGTPQEKIPRHACKGLLYAGAIYSFAGISGNPEKAWISGNPRPYCPLMKKVCWLLGVGFRKAGVNEDDLHDEEEFRKKVRNREDAAAKKDKRKPREGDEFEALVLKKRDELDAKNDKVLTDENALYCRLYRVKHKEYVRRNEQGHFANAARERMESKLKKGLKLTDDQKECWPNGKLQSIGIHTMAGRYAAKMFLSHFHQIGRELFFGEKVTPWILTQPGHGRYIPPPCWVSTIE